MTQDNDIMERFTKAYEELSDAIFRHCWFKIGDREKAKDLMQDTFTKSWQYIAEGATVNNFKSFLYRVANNLIIDEYRKKKELSLDRLQEDGFEPGFDDRHKNENRIDAQFAISAINQLDEKYREVILMRYIDELSPKEIAEITGESENNVSVRLHRGINQLKDILDTNESR
ncbi:MAG: RNA polymerase sigma factor [Candidatus Taylorbacteria bacterium]|nr:RNA polymerase sigma factor [Candidatus Taylorbacteria bacterium]